MLLDVLRSEDRPRRSVASYFPIALLVILIIAVVGVSAAASRLPDLRVLSVWYSPATVHAGDSLTVTSRIGNAGHTIVPRTVAQFYLSPGKKRSSDSVMLSGTQSVPGLKYSDLLTFVTIVDVPRETPAGRYYVVVCGDASRSILESNERNNCRSSNTQITVIVP